MKMYLIASIFCGGVHFRVCIQEREGFGGCDAGGGLSERLWQPRRGRRYRRQGGPGRREDRGQKHADEHNACGDSGERHPVRQDGRHGRLGDGGIFLGFVLLREGFSY